MSLYPILWAAEHAPVKDAEERAILVGLVMKGDFDGSNCYRSYPTLAAIARVDPKTAGRKCRAMEARGVLRRQTGRMPEGWKRLPKDKRPVVWEAMIPADFWSAAQLDEINQQRRERGRPPITPQNRPSLHEAPSKRARSDKGKERPDRRKNTDERGDSQSPRLDPSGGTLSPVAGGLSVPSRGDSQSPNPLISPSDKPSSPLPPTPAAVPAQHQHKEEEAQADKNPHQDVSARLVDDLPPVGVSQRRPNAALRRRLIAAVTARLVDGWTPAGLRAELAANLGGATSPGVYWHRLDNLPATPPPSAPTPTSETTRPVLPPWCGRCDKDRRVDVDEHDRTVPCPRCSPQATRPAETAVAVPAQRITRSAKGAPGSTAQSGSEGRLVAVVAGLARGLSGEG